MMTQSKGLYLTATPVIFLLLLSAGARLMATQESSAAPNPPASANQTPSANLKPADAKTQHLLEQVVSGQLTAIRKKDYVAALKFSDPSFRKSMPPANFGRMITLGYAPMASSVSAKFRPAQLQGTMAAVPATVVGKDGTKTLYLYLLVKGADSWTIASCQAAVPPPRREIHHRRTRNLIATGQLIRLGV